MARRRHTPEQVIRKLREGEKLIGEKFSIEEVCKHLEISEASWHRWQAQYGGMKSDDAKRSTPDHRARAATPTDPLRSLSCAHLAATAVGAAARTTALTDAENTCSS